MLTLRIVTAKRPLRAKIVLPAADQRLNWDIGLNFRTLGITLFRL